MNWTMMETLIACPACSFDAESQTTMAASMAIAFMVGIVAVVLSGFIALIVRLARGERRALNAGAQES